MAENTFNPGFKNKAMLLLLWGIVQFSILFTHGINTEGEALRFIQEANKMDNLEAFSSPVYFLYLIEILLIYIKLTFSLSFHFIVAIQLIMNLAAVSVFKKFVDNLYQSEKVSIIATSLLILCIPYQFFNSYIYTESFFFSLSIIFSCYLLSRKKITWKELLIITAGLVLLCITRPTGIFFAGATFVWFFFNVFHSFSIVRKLSIFFLVMLILLFFVNFIMGNGHGVNVLTPFKAEHVICDVPTIIKQTEIDANEDNSIIGLVIYILKHPMQFTRLAYLKTLAFFGLNRTYFSFLHNLFTDTYFYSLYLLIFAGMIQWKKTELKYFIFHLSLIFIFWMAVVFSCDEWNNRFFLTLTPFLILMALPTIQKRLK